MADSALFSVQKAVYARLTGDSAFAASVSGVFDDVQEGKAFPYVTIGDVTEVPFDVFAKNGHEQTLTFHVWSQKAGFKEAFQIQGAMDTLLHGYAMTVDNHTTVRMEHEATTSLRDPDGVTRHLAVRYRCTVMDT